MPGRFRLHHLEIFWTVIRTGSQREAAKLLRLSQPAVSRLLRYVEDQVGIPLFRRSKGRLIPTPEAEIFFESVEEVFRAVDKTERLVRDLKRRNGQAMLVSVPGLGANFVPEVVGRFLKQLPEVQVSITSAPTALVMDRVLKKQAHIGLVYGPVTAAAAETITLCTAQIVCALPPTHKLVARSFITPEDLEGEPLITAEFMPQWGQLVGQAFDAAGVSRKIVSGCANSDIAYKMAAEGVGIAVVPIAPSRHATDRTVVLRRFVPEISVPVLAVLSRDDRVGQLTEKLIGYLRKSTDDYTWIA